MCSVGTILYYAPPCTEHVRTVMSSRIIGCIDTPKQGKINPHNSLWIADNSCFSVNYPGDTKWEYWLNRKSNMSDMLLCGFATVPDVVGDAKSTLNRFLELNHIPRKYGYRVGYVAQDGFEHHTPSADIFDVLFIGGSTEFKLGDGGKLAASYALAAGKPVHMGRVNSYKRLKYAYDLGCSSVDGTFLTYGPDINLPILLRWLSKLEEYANSK